MLACTAMLVGCSDDAIDNIAQENNELKSDAKGYLTVSFSAGTNSSRGLYDNANGDKHGNSEHSGHENAGTANENKINEVLVVIKSNSAEYSKLYSTTAATTNNGTVEENFQDSNNGQVYTMTNPFEVALGSYNTLVVVNPNTGIKELRTAASPDKDGKTATKEYSLYDKILNYQVNPIADPQANTLVDAINLVTESATTGTRDNFMMTNQQAVTIDVNIDNSAPEFAAGRDQEVLVERVVSKITYRPTSYTGDKVTLTDEEKLNLYYVPFTSYEMNGEKVSAYIGENTTATELVRYTLSDGTTAYKDNDNNFYTVVKENEKNFATLINDANKTAGAEIYYERSETAKTSDWFVKLEKYALVNLSKDLYAVRHIGTGSYADDNSGVTIMGQLNGSNIYLVDPVSTTKNTMVWGDNGAWPSTVTATTWNSWFFSPWETVKDETVAGLKTDGSSLFKALSGTAENPQEVTAYDTPNKKDGVYHNTDNTNPEVGQHLSYCFENAVKRANDNNELQTIGLSTAIVFQAQIQELKDGKLQDLTTDLYQYDGNIYTSIDDIRTLYGYGEDTDWENATSDAELEALGVKIYKSGKCYYYTSQIKHFDDGNNQTNGVMEFVIMRNNIYSLAVTGIKNIGDANLNGFNPGEVDESNTAYIQVNAKILPWIVRFTDVEF